MEILTLSNHDKEIINGHLLGDASLIKTKQRSLNCVYTFSSKHREYLEYHLNNISFCKDRPIWIRSYLDKRTNKTYTSYWMRTKESSIFSELRTLWYPKDIKIVPDIELTPLTCFYWYLDDGCLINKKNIKLATDCFSLENINILVNKLKTNLNTDKISIYKNGNGYQINLRVEATEKFLNYIGTNPIPIFDYKFNVATSKSNLA